MKSNRTLGFYGASHRMESPDQTSTSNFGMFRKNDVNKGNLKDIHKTVKGGAPGEYVYVARMGEVFMIRASDNLDLFTDPPDGDIPAEYQFTSDKEEKDLDDADPRVSTLGRSTRYAHVGRAFTRSPSLGRPLAYYAGTGPAL